MLTLGKLLGSIEELSGVEEGSDEWLDKIQNLPIKISIKSETYEARLIYADKEGPIVLGEA